MTIGCFIAKKRKEIGLTQKELGEKLFVSDKTVSRWERDECALDACMIPKIAEILGVKVEELLNGEVFEKQTNKMQVEFCESKRKSKSAIFTVISIGCSFLGLIGCVIANFYKEGLLAFCIAIACILSGVVLQVCFLMKTTGCVENTDEEDFNKIKRTNRTMKINAFLSLSIALIITAFCLPIITTSKETVLYGLRFDTWLISGLIYDLVALLIILVFYCFLKNKIFK